MLALAAPSPNTFVDYGAALIAAGSIFSVVSLLQDKERLEPVGVVFLAVGSVMVLAPEFHSHRSGFSTYWQALALIGLVTFVAAASTLVMMLCRVVRAKLGEGGKGTQHDKQHHQQAPRPVGASDVRTKNVGQRQHLPTVGGSARRHPVFIVAVAGVVLLARALFRREKVDT